MNSGLRSGWHRPTGAVEWNATLGGINMDLALLNRYGQVVMTFDSAGDMYLVKKAYNNIAPGPWPDAQDLLYADFFALLPLAGQFILATDSNLIAYSHFLPLGSDIPQNIQPALTVGAAAGTGATANYQAGVYSGDASGMIHIRSGSAATATGTVLTVTFGSAYNPNAPVPHVEQYTSIGLGVNIGFTGANAITFSVTTAMTINTDYYFFYHTFGV